MTTPIPSAPALPPVQYGGIELYNNLPTLGEADDAFTPKARAILISEVGELLARYGCLWGLCLVHAHCSLEAGETMVGRGNTSQPENVEAEDVFPERWLSDGRPYEYNIDKTEPPPAELIVQFKALVGANGLDGTPGLYYVGDKVPELVLESTVGRANVVRAVTEIDEQSSVKTGWAPIMGGAGMPVTMACMLYCVPGDGKGGKLHTGTRSHA
ncbi:hypothetical protein MVEN_02140000 [Mycena venus]|uniref:Uncharacterized protein n=1 Tax=Mycena venus TaxID=2733690 RepID=A0A8H7CIC1_9AGAR|nr:hypothetical protein MVEN_02140000 [Mycena venus]